VEFEFAWPFSNFLKSGARLNKAANWNAAKWKNAGSVDWIAVRPLYAASATSQPNLPVKLNVGAAS